MDRATGVEIKYSYIEFFHDESSIHSNDQGLYGWFSDDIHALRPKLQRDTWNISDFFCEWDGPLHNVCT